MESYIFRIDDFPSEEYIGHIVIITDETLYCGIITFDDFDNLSVKWVRGDDIEYIRRYLAKLN